MRNTKELITNIKRMSSPDELLKEDYREIDFPTYIKEEMKEHNIKPRDIIVQLNMEKSYFYQIMKGRRAPRRDFLLKFAFLLHMNLDETQQLLEIAHRTPLYPRNKKDAAAIYAITHKMNYEQYETILETLEDEHE